MSRRILIVTAVQGEADAIGRHKGTFVVAGGIGRTNAAAATTASMLSDGPFQWILNIGIAGALPNSGLSLGDVVVASACTYVEEGLQTPDGFQNMQEMGFSLGNFEGNVVPTDPWMFTQLEGLGTTGIIATVATCSGTDEQANLVQTRSGALCEAMEGAAVVHAAGRLNTPAIEIRIISNTTGDRDQQVWDTSLALSKLSEVTELILSALWNPLEQSCETS